MSAVRDAIDAIRQTLVLSEKVQRAAQRGAQLAATVADHERRLIRLEAKWEIVIELASVQRSRQIDS